MVRYLGFSIEPRSDGTFALIGCTDRVRSVVSGQCPEYWHECLGTFVTEGEAEARIRFEVERKVRHFDASGKELIDG